MVVYHAYHKEKPVFYIGKTTRSLKHRRKQHENESYYNRTNSHFHRALKKYGINSFDWRILEECESVEELNACEIKWIELVKECGHKLYNIAKGGTGGDVGGSVYWKNNSPSLEMRKKISQGLKSYYKRNGHPKKGKKCKGHKHTEETKIKISKSKMGHKVLEETREKLRLINTGKKLQPHVIKVLSEKFSGEKNPSARPVYCVTTGEYFAYAKLAAIKYNIDLSSIIKCCRGKLKTCKKMVFEYYTESQPPQGWQIVEL